jgi:LacI family transcriptional regulator
MVKRQYPTLQLIAKESGFSRSTVGHVLNDRVADLRISKQTTEHIRRVARLHGYRPNPLSRGLLNKGTRSIGVLWSASGPHNTIDVIRSITDRLRDHGYSSYFTDHRSDPHIAKAALEDLLLRRADAVVLHASFETDLPADIAERLDSFAARVVIVDDPVAPPLQRETVFYDHGAAMAEVGNYWVSQGRRSVAFVGPYSGNERKVSNLRQAVERIHAGRVAVLDTKAQDPAAFAEAVESSLQAGEPYDAVACSTDEGALAVLRVLRQRHLAVPGRVALAGFNNNPFTPFTDVPLASVDRVTSTLASIVEERLFAQLEGAGDASPQPIRVPMRFVWRESAGRHPESSVRHEATASDAATNPPAG